MGRERTRALILMVALAVGAAAGPGAGAVTELVSADAAISGVFGGLWMAQEVGAFARQGLDSSLVYISSSTQIAQAMLSGEVPIALMGGEAVVNAVLGGADMGVVGGAINRPLVFMVVTPGIQRPPDLQGKALGVSRYGASSDFATRLALRHWAWS